MAAIGTDRITSEVLRNSLINIVDNMENGLLRTAFSLVARDLRDVACGIHSPPDQGLDLVASAAGVPILSVVSHFALRENLVEFGVEELRPGDELIFNDPFRGGNHAPDVTLARPVFAADGDLLAICASRSHWVDVGGASPGSWPVGGNVRTVMEETSLRLPPMLLFREGTAVKSTHSLILDGTRRPDLVLGDLRAQHTANLIGEREILALVARYGRAAFSEAMQYTVAHGEALMREALRELPDGDYEAEETLDDDGVERGPFLLRARLAVRGDRAELDFSGSARQTIGNSSSPWGMSAACAHVAFKSLVDASMPSNGGVFSCLDLVLPAGSLAHALPYHACADGNGTVGPKIASLLIRIMNQVRPELALGDVYGAAAVTNFGGVADPRPGRGSRPWIFFHSSFSGLGATAEGDGQSYVKIPLANCVDPSTEAIEQDAPVMVVAKELTPDSGGPGLNRGGLGTRYVIGLLADAVAANSTEHVLTANFGAQGGKGSHRSMIDETEGIAAALRETPGTVTPVAGAAGTEGEPDGAFLTGKFLGRPVAADHVWHKYVPGGGGWGDPLEREAHVVARDAEDGLVTPKGARDDYGVVLTDGFDVDEPATARLRAELAVDPEFLARTGPATWQTSTLDRAS